MIAAWAVVVALLLALPALAWWVGARDVWSRPGRKSQPDLYRQLVRRHSLRPAEAAQVEGAVTWGRELQDPRLRAAVVDWAQSLQRVADKRAAAHPRRAGLLRVLGVLWLVLAAGALLGAVLDGNWTQLVSASFWPLIMAVPMAKAIGGPRRAIERNSGPASTARST